MLFCQGIVLFCQARCFFLTTASKNLRTPLWIVKSMESAARTLLKTFLPIRRQPPGAAQSSRRRPSLPQRLVIFGAGPHREDGFPCPDKKTRCSELFSAVLTKKRRLLTKQHDAPNDSPAPPAEFIAVSTICGAVLTKKHAPLVPEQLAFSTERLFWFHTLDPQR